MSAHVARAHLLLQQGRPADAQRELFLALAQDPQQPLPHALLALCRLELDNKGEALDSARRAVGLAPDDPYLHYVLATVLHRLDRDKEAREAADECIRIDPENAEGFALLASIHLSMRDWPAALAAAEQGLALDPEHVDAANLRAMALVRMGRKDEATRTVDFALRRAPENAFSHANQGWNLLHRNDPRRAQEHFREALRLEPDLEYARQGMLEALKARNPVYRGMLAYFLWIGRQGGKLQWAFIIGTYAIFRFVFELARSWPVLWVVVALFYLFIYLSWTSVPMFNLLLRFDRFGRYVLSRKERIASNWFGATLFMAVVLLGLSLAGGGTVALVAGLEMLAVSVCVAALFDREGRNRLILAAATAVLVGLGIISGVALANGDAKVATASLNLFGFTFLGTQVLANFLASK